MGSPFPTRSENVVLKFYRCVEKGRGTLLRHIATFTITESKVYVTKDKYMKSTGLKLVQRMHT